MSEINHDLQTASEPAIPVSELAKGHRICVASSAGRRLAGKHGIVVGKGATKNQVRVLLDGSKSFITLHARFVTPI